MNLVYLRDDLRALSYAFTIEIEDDYSSIIVRDFNLPPGYNRGQIPILLDLPYEYPENPPGVGQSRVYVPNDLRYYGRKPNDFHDLIGPPGWAWWCYERIDWNPRRDDLMSFFELLRAHMTEPY
jgi:hypothetical protein